MASTPDYPDPRVIEQLADPQAYPCDPDAASDVEVVQTHLSHVFLTRTRVYKFRKAVDLPFVCFASRAERNADCLREVRLNRRLAPDVYLGVAPLTVRSGVRVGPLAEVLAESEAGVVEHCVVMRRLPEHRDALCLLENGELRRQHLERLAERMVIFHQDNALGVPAPFDPLDWRERCTAPMAASFATIAETGVDVGPALTRARSLALAFVRDHEERFERRRRDGRAVDAHGDLHLQHIWFEQDASEPVVIDCLEFDPRLRQIDVAAEIAFTAMDLGYRGHPELANLFLRHYARASDDFDLYGVVDFFACYRAVVRAKVAAIAAGDPALDATQRASAGKSARRHVEFAETILEPRGPGALVLVGGVVGTGKTTVAGALADVLDRAQGAAIISSDRVRKRLAKLGPLARVHAGPDEGLYAPQAVARTYAALLEGARPVLRSGRVAILDATWESHAERGRAWRLARELGARALYLETRCPADVVLERLKRRQQDGGDPSDAGPERYAISVQRFEPLDASELAHLRIVRTDERDWRDQVIRLARELSG